MSADGVISGTIMNAHVTDHSHTLIPATLQTCYIGLNCCTYKQQFGNEMGKNQSLLDCYMPVESVLLPPKVAPSPRFIYMVAKIGTKKPVTFINMRFEN